MPTLSLAVLEPVVIAPDECAYFAALGARFARLRKRHLLTSMQEPALAA